MNSEHQTSNSEHRTSNSELATELREAPATRGEFACHELEAWAADFGLVAGITDRGADFGLASPEPAGQVLDRWRRLREAMRPHFRSLAVGHQCHGTTLAVHQRQNPGWWVADQVDGHLTDQPGQLLAVTVADCVPVYLAQVAGPWAGLLHAGWRGIAAGIIEAGVSRLCELSGARAADIVTHCGVSICGNCYEVGPEVREAVTGNTAREKSRLDLRYLVAERAAKAGVRRVTVTPWCTAHDESSFYSHRRSQGADGRMVAYLGRLGRPLA